MRMQFDNQAARTQYSPRIHVFYSASIPTVIHSRFKLDGCNKTLQVLIKTLNYERWINDTTAALHSTVVIWIFDNDVNPKFSLSHDLITICRKHRHTCTHQSEHTFSQNEYSRSLFGSDWAVQGNQALLVDLALTSRCWYLQSFTQNTQIWAWYLIPTKHSSSWTYSCADMKWTLCNSEEILETNTSNEEICKGISQMGGLHSFKLLGAECFCKVASLFFKTFLQKSCS